MTKKLTRLIILSWILVLIGCSPGRGEGTGFPLPPNYQGIILGQSTEEEVSSILGEPDKVSVWEPANEYSWYYYDLRVLVVLSLQNQTVNWIRVRDQAHTLGEIIDKYGEPELILLSHPDSCSPDEYLVTSLEYPGQGISAVLWDIPPFSRDFIVTDLFYSEPMMTEAYFERFGDTRDCDKIIEWPGFEE